MKNYYIEYSTTKDGIEYTKWVPSIHYEFICEELLELMKGGGNRVSRFGPAFVLTLVACFEANLNDWLIIDTFEKHGPSNYEAIVNGYISLGPKAKYRVAVSVMTDNAFQVREECSTIQDLDELIDIRNKFVHTRPRFYHQVTKHKIRPKKQRAQDHPFFLMKISDCRRYYAAVKRFDRLFLRQYDRGEIKENQMIKVLQKILHQKSR